MEMEQVYKFIADLFVGGGLIIAVAAFVLGMIIKQSLSFIPNKFIPLIGGIVGIVLGVFIPDIFPEADYLTAGIQGLALGWAATGGYETIKQLTNKKEEE